MCILLGLFDQVLLSYCVASRYGTWLGCVLCLTWNCTMLQIKLANTCMWIHVSSALKQAGWISSQPTLKINCRSKVDPQKVIWIVNLLWRTHIKTSVHKHQTLLNLFPYQYWFDDNTNTHAPAYVSQVLRGQHLTKSTRNFPTNTEIFLFAETLLLGTRNINRPIEQIRQVHASYTAIAYLTTSTKKLSTGH